MLYLIHHRVNSHGEIRPPNSAEAESHFQIPASTIRQWKKKYMNSYVEKQPHIPPPKWPGLKEDLYLRFLVRRACKMVVNTS